MSTYVLCLQIIRKHYPLSSQRIELINFMFEFDTNSTEISVPVQEIQVSLNTLWTSYYVIIFTAVKCLQMHLFSVGCVMQDLKHDQTICQKQTFMSMVLESKPFTQNKRKAWKIMPLKTNKVCYICLQKC